MSLLYYCYVTAKEVYVLAKGSCAEGMGMLAHKNHVTNAQRGCSIRYNLCYNNISFSWVDYSSCMKWHTFTVVTVHWTSQPGSKPGTSCILVISTSAFCSTVSGKYLPW